MRNPSLHAALREFSLEAANALTKAVDSGDELGYDVAEEPGSGAVLYRYRARTAEYIGARWADLAALPSLEQAAHELGAGASTWLRSHGRTGAEAEPALRAMLERLFEDATSFDFPEERFERIYAELERTLFDGRIRVAAVAPLRGALLESPRVELGSGIALVRGDRADAPREAVWPHPRLAGADPGPNVLIVIDRESEDGAEIPLDRFRARVADIVRGLRLWAPGAIGPGGGGWVRSDQGPWQYFELDQLGPGRGRPWTLSAAEENELREFLGAIENARVPGRIAWALDRFELGCERTRDAEALSDFLMALRALLDANDEPGRASLSLRLAALCAEEPDRRAVQRRTEMAFTLERFLMGGGSAEAYVDEIGTDSPAEITSEVEACVRALLRDILCGYLEADLRRTADDILLTSNAPVEIEARDIRDEEEPEPEPVAAEPPKPKRKRRATGNGERATGNEQRATVQQELDAGVTPSADWGFDDADCYSAPV